MAVQRGQRAASQRERVAQMAVNAAEAHLEEVARTLEKELLRLCGGNRQHPHFLRYLPGSSGVSVRLGLESEIRAAEELGRALGQRARIVAEGAGRAAR